MNTDSEIFEGMMRMNGFDDCILGIVEGAGVEPVICYSVSKIIEQHIKDGMTEDEAYEFFEFNQVGAYVGNKTPVFLRDDDSYEN